VRNALRIFTVWVFSPIGIGFRLPTILAFVVLFVAGAWELRRVGKLDVAVILVISAATPLLVLAIASEVYRPLFLDRVLLPVRTSVLLLAGVALLPWLRRLPLAFAVLLFLGISASPLLTIGRPDQHHTAQALTILEQDHQAGIPIFVAPASAVLPYDVLSADDWETYENLYLVKDWDRDYGLGLDTPTVEDMREALQRAGDPERFTLSVSSAQYPAEALADLAQRYRIIDRQSLGNITVLRYAR
jgi:hypothetical protein